MTTFRAAAVQMRSGIDPQANVAAAEALIRQAASEGADYVLTPEMTALLDMRRSRLLSNVHSEADDPSLARFRDIARELGIVLHIGSLAVLVAEGRVANRAFVIGRDAAILATYDKLHCFDVDLGGGEAYRESALYEAGDDAVVVELPFARLGVSICYDVRFPNLYRALAREGANVLAVPAAFTRTTGQAHWTVLLRARAIEAGAFVVAAAQGGHHEDGRSTYGHSMIVDPWGVVRAELDDAPGFILADIDTQESKRARARIPSLSHDRPFRVVRVAPEREAVS